MRERQKKYSKGKGAFFSPLPQTSRVHLTGMRVAEEAAAVASASATVWDVCVYNTDPPFFGSRAKEVRKKERERTHTERACK